MKESDYAGYTPLLTAVFYNSKECVQTLFNQEKASRLFELFLIVQIDSLGSIDLCGNLA